MIFLQAGVLFFLHGYANAKLTDAVAALCVNSPILNEGGERSVAEAVGHQAAFSQGHPCRMFVAQSAGCGARLPTRAPGPPLEATLTEFIYCGCMRTNVPTLPQMRYRLIGPPAGNSSVDTSVTTWFVSNTKPPRAIWPFHVSLDNL